MLEYSDEDEYEDEYDGALAVYEDVENGYYEIAFGHEEHHEVHSVAVDEWELELPEDDIYRRCKREYLIEDIKGKAEEIEYDLTGIDIERLTDYVEKVLEHNDGMYESYWMSIEYAIEDF